MSNRRKLAVGRIKPLLQIVIWKLNEAISSHIRDVNLMHTI